MNNLTERLKIKNISGDVFDLHPNYDEFAVLNVEGLSPPDTNINITDNGLYDGSAFNSAYVNSRNIVLQVVLFGNNERCRKKLYKMFPLKQEITLYYQNSQFDVETTGYVESFVLTPYRFKELAQISIVCPSAYLTDRNDLEAELAAGDNTIEYRGDTQTGFTAEIQVENAETELEITERISATPEEIMSNTVLIPLSTSEYDPSTQMLDVYVNGVLKTEGTHYTVKFYTYENNSRDLYLKFKDSSLLNIGDTVKIDVYTIGSAPVEHEFYDTQSPYAQQDRPVAAIYGKPAWLDSANANITYISAKQYSIYGTMTELIDGVENPEWAFSDSWDTGEIAVYYRLSGGDVNNNAITLTLRGTTTEPNQKIVSVTKTVTVSLPDKVFRSYESYTSDDLVRIYMGDSKLTNWTIEVVSLYDGTLTTAKYCIHLGTTMTDCIRSQIIKSTTPGTDVSGYTDAQVDEGAKFVNNMAVAIDGHKLKFSGVQLQPNDKVQISTVSGDIYAKLLRGISTENLLYAISPDSEFIKIAPGENTLSVTADTNQALLSGTLTAKQYYGGV